ncbi:MAG: pyridoxal phosphate-dependent aminotransferase [Colwellia sp.]|nr:pyridoxal phosphate-dependent aminotransferase [Colwellia sp.]
MNIQLPAHIAFGQRLAQNPKVNIEFNLSDSCAQSLSVNALCQLANSTVESVLGKQELSYAPLWGGEALRQLIVDFHQSVNNHEIKLTFEDVLTFCGAQEALSAIYQCLFSTNSLFTSSELAESEIVVITPCYPSLVTMAEQLGIKVNCLLLDPEQEWQITFKELSCLVNEKTRLIVVNSPHNPSGSVITSELADEILALAKKFNCYLLADDVSQMSNYHQLPLAHRYLDYDKAIVVSVLSKSFGLSGLRIGWAVTKNKVLLKQLLAFKAQSSICTSAVDEKLAELALTHHQKIINDNNNITYQNIILFQQFIDDNPQYLSWQPPQAGLLGLVKCHSQTPLLEWAEQLAEQAGILVYPACLFGLNDQYFRIGLGKTDFSLILTRLQLFIDGNLSAQ